MDRPQRPIVFSSANVRRILSGAKTQTRRVVRPQPDRVMRIVQHDGRVALRVPDRDAPLPCPYGAAGDGLWVREPWHATFRYEGAERPWHAVPPEARTERTCTLLLHQADGPSIEHDWVTPIFMPRWASRLHITLTSVRAELLQDVSAFDVADEGISASEVLPPHRRLGPSDLDDATAAFRTAWNAVQPDASTAWDANPWVWVLAFERAHPFSD